MFYQSAFELGHVALNVKDLESQILFYQQVLGLELLERGDQLARLGVGDRELVRLQTATDLRELGRVAGLYHLALLLPSREDLSHIFRHFLFHQVSLIGASDHGYSEAIYLEDPEGNGIEVYRDLPEETWDKRADGRIVGKTAPLDEEGLFYLTDFSQTYQLPRETRMGHVHLQSPSSQKSSKLYQNIFSLGDKFSLPTGSWLASGNYHHHLAVNEWAGKGLLKRQPGMPGLAYYSLVFDNIQAYKVALTKARVAGLEVDVAQESAAIYDQDGICVKISHR